MADSSGHWQAEEMQVLTTPAKRILVVEDVETTRRRLAALLDSEGYTVDQAVDGMDALRKVGGAHYDAIMLDLVMPHVSGWNFREAALRRPELRAIPTVVMTVQPLRAPDRYVLQTPFIINKPFDDATVRAILKQAFATRAPATPLRPVQVVDDGLFWSRRGEVACATHAPAIDTTRWQDEHWSPVQRVGTRLIYQCQHCAGGDGPIAKRSPT
jgi:CheY-like chemotaxis protein